MLSSFVQFIFVIGFAHSCVVVAFLAIFVFAFVAWPVFIALKHGSIRSGLHWLGRPWSAQSGGRNANSTFPIWWDSLLMDC